MSRRVKLRMHALSLYCKTTRLDTPARVCHPYIVFDVKFEINNSWVLFADAFCIDSA